MSLGCDLVSRQRKDVGVASLISGRIFDVEPLIRAHLVTSNARKIVCMSDLASLTPSFLSIFQCSRHIAAPSSPRA